MIWLILAGFLPPVFVTAILVRPPVPPPAPDTRRTLSATIEDLTDSTSLVTVKVENFIKAPSCVVILSNPSKEIVLGTLSKKGDYTFVVPSIGDPITLKLWDAIHQRSIASIPLDSKN